MSWLCRVGLHKWRLIIRNHWFWPQLPGRSNERYQRCQRCGSRR